MKLKKVLHIILILIFVLSILGASSLVYDEFINESICPKIFNIPACYIIMGCFIMPLLGHLLKWNNYIYFIGTGLAFSIALYGTTSQLLEIVQCPKTSTGIPMCFISLSIFTSLIFLKIMLLKIKKQI
ncbi:hypothetical protein [Polaribacter atrinae]|uniref:hypothetical protein n=1 Tax=Polaribacter atrinae TaxID=1333662 RepID=UPI002493A3E2|nr:hypothetical protein [Polaribacter atrinae]